MKAEYTALSVAKSSTDEQLASSETQRKAGADRLDAAEAAHKAKLSELEATILQAKKVNAGLQKEVAELSDALAREQRSKVGEGAPYKCLTICSDKRPSCPQIVSRHFSRLRPWRACRKPARTCRQRWRMRPWRRSAPTPKLYEYEHHISLSSSTLH